MWIVGNSSLQRGFSSYYQKAQADRGAMRYFH